MKTELACHDKLKNKNDEATQLSGNKIYFEEIMTLNFPNSMNISTDKLKIG